jgi:hypothetical protein
MIQLGGSKGLNQCRRIGNEDLHLTTPCILGITCDSTTKLYHFSLLLFLTFEKSAKRAQPYETLNVFLTLIAALRQCVLFKLS